jgi:hypothetical protein
MAWHRGRLASALFIKIWLPIATGDGGNEHDLFAVQEDVGFAAGQEDVFIDDVDVIKRRTIDANRPAGDKQFYISRVPEVANPVFENEPAYRTLKVPDAGFQLLGLYRYWNVIEYWSPNRKVMGEDWNQILTEFIPRIAFAKDRDTYQTEFIALIAKVNDTHANLWRSIRLRPPLGDCQLPVTLRKGQYPAALEHNPSPGRSDLTPDAFDMHFGFFCALSVGGFLPAPAEFLLIYCCSASSCVLRASEETPREFLRSFHSGCRAARPP